MSFSRNFVDSCPQAILYPAAGILAQLVVLVVVIYYCEVRRQKDIFLHRGTIAHMFQQIQELSTNLREISQCSKKAPTNVGGAPSLLKVAIIHAFNKKQHSSPLAYVSLPQKF